MLAWDLTEFWTLLLGMCGSLPLWDSRVGGRPLGAGFLGALAAEDNLGFSRARRSLLVFLSISFFFSFFWMRKGAHARDQGRGTSGERPLDRRWHGMPLLATDATRDTSIPSCSAPRTGIPPSM